MVKRKQTAKDRKLAAEWEQMLKKHTTPLEKGLERNVTKNRKLFILATSHQTNSGFQAQSSDVRRNSVQPAPQQNTSLRIFEGMKGSTSKVQQTYTGTKIIGIATMHKSNMVPIFTKDEAKDVATMRRN